MEGPPPGRAAASEGRDRKVGEGGVGRERMQNEREGKSARG